MAPAGESPQENIDVLPPPSGESIAISTHPYTDVGGESERFWIGMRALSGDVMKAYMELSRPACSFVSDEQPPNSPCEADISVIGLADGT